MHSAHGLAALLVWALASPTAKAAPKLPKVYAAPAEVGKALIGTPATEWTLGSWLNSEPLSLAGLRGKVVVVRWWTAPGCPFCAASANSLEALWSKYRDRGLVVIGAYHHKDDTPLTLDHVRRHTKRLGFTFPVAIDEDWKTLRRWWLDREAGGWTSVTFVLDREGNIRHVHGGGAYFEGDPGLARLETAITEALDKKSQ